MNDYLELEKLYYKKVNIEEEYQNRIKNPCSIKTNLFINPFNARGEKLNQINFELFYLPLENILKLQDKIVENSKKITELANELPEVAKASGITEILMNEIVKSNEVEGVYTTKKEIYDSMNSQKEDRLSGIIRKYKQIEEKRMDKIYKVEDFRKLYDDVFANDILLNPGNKLDGKFFRNSPAHISDGLKNIHTGVANEKLIIKCLEDLIKFMNDDFNFLIKACVTHYYFEYIHPFYDGNGRIGRLLCSMYLAKKLDIFTGLSISYSIFSDKNKYLKLFKDVSNEKNCGELTFFIKGFLEFIEKGQENIIEMLVEKKEKLDYVEDFIEKLNLEKIEKNILSMYSQNQIFSKIIPLEDRDLESILKISRPTLNRILKKLENDGYLEKIMNKPSVHILTDKIEM